MPDKGIVMKSKCVLFIILTTLSLSSNAGPFTDELSKCLVKSTTQADKELLITWIYAAMSAHPKVKVLSNISNKKGEELNKNTADLFMNLLTVRCKSETEVAFKYEGVSTFSASFEVLGRVAMQGIMSNPDVNNYMSGLDKYIDTKEIENAFGTK